MPPNVTVPFEIEEVADEHGHRRWVGTVKVIYAGGSMSVVKSMDSTGPKALAKAATAADKLTDGIVSNPLVRALLPPGTPEAVKGLKMIAQGVASGNVDEVLKRFTGPAAARAQSVVNTLRSIF